MLLQTLWDVRQKKFILRQWHAMTTSLTVAYVIWLPVDSQHRDPGPDLITHPDLSQVVNIWSEAANRYLTEDLHELNLASSRR